MTTTRPGDYITAKCGRCNDITGHVVMVVIDGEIIKVECKACGSIHKYRDKTPSPVKRAANTSVRHVKAGQSRENAREVGRQPSPRSSSTARATKSAKAEQAWNEAMLRHSGEDPIPYSMTGSYVKSALIEHGIFGKGEVISVTAPDKMNVLFQAGVKTLRCKI